MNSLCIDARMWFSSGIGTYLRAIVPKLESLFEVTLLVQKKEVEKVRLLSKAKLIEMNSSIYTLFEQIELFEKIPACDLFWSPHYNIPLLPIRARKKAVTIHDVCHLANPDCFSKGKRILAHFLLSQSVKKTDLLLTVSAFSKGEISRFFPKNKKEVYVASCGSPSKKKCQQLEISSPFILYVGNNKPHKNIERLIEAFFHLPTSSLSLVLAGTSFSKQLSPQVKVIESPSEEELAFLYTHARALIHPSLYEGFGLTTLEAMAYGCPVVSSYFASLPEVCCKAALYIDPFSIESISQGIEVILKNSLLREQLVQEGSKRILAFSWDKTTDLIADLFLKELKK